MMQAQPQPEPLPQRQRQYKATISGTLLVAALITGLLGWGLGAWLSPIDNLSQQEIVQREQLFASRMQPFSIPVLDKDEVLQQVQQLPLSGEQQSNLLAQLLKSNANTRLVALTVWDDVAPDGDVIQISSAGYTQSVTLSKSPQTLHFPVSEERPVVITGIHDGGGGITLGFTGSGQPVALPVLAEGQSLNILLR